MKWVMLKLRRICALFCRETQIEVRVLLEGDTRAVLVTDKIPKDLRKGRTGAEFLAHDDYFWVACGQERGRTSTKLKVIVDPHSSTYDRSLWALSFHFAISILE